MVKKALFVKLEAKPGKEAELEKFLRSALPLAEKEPGTRTWYALRFGPSTFGIYDTFADDAGRQAHVNGEIAKALFAHADELLASKPNIEQVDVLEAKLP